MFARAGSTGIERCVARSRWRQGKAMRFVALLALSLMLAATAPASAGPPAGAFAFELRSIDGEPMPLSRYAGKALLIVNTASFCGFTYQYDALQALADRYAAQGLVVIGVPSGDFAGQEYGSNAEIKTFCETRFDIAFPMSEKVHVKGPQAHPLFAWLKQELGEEGVPRWNFTKFLIAPDGRAVASWPSAVEPADPAINQAIAKVLPAA